MTITAAKIEDEGSVFSPSYCYFRRYIAEILNDALENGDAVQALKDIQSDFRKALYHELESQGQETLALKILNL